MITNDLEERVSRLESLHRCREITPEQILSIFKDILRIAPQDLYKFRVFADVAREHYPDEVNALLEGREHLLINPSERG